MVSAGEGCETAVTVRTIVGGLSLGNVVNYWMNGDFL